MRCLKIFPRLFILIIISLAGCVSGNRDNINISPESENRITESESELLQPEGLIKNDPVVEDPSPEPFSDFIIEEVIVDSLVWAEPDANKYSSKTLLPEYSLHNKVDESPETIFSSKELLDNDVVIPDSVPVGADSFVSEVSPLEEKTQSESYFEENSVSREVESESSAPPEEVIIQRQMAGSLDDEVEILLTGRGWTFLSSDKSDEIEYLGRYFGENSTVYKFLPKQEGLFTLIFQYQNLIDDIYKKEVVTLTVSGVIDEATTKTDKQEETEEKNETVSLTLTQKIEKFIKDDNIKELADLTGIIVEENRYKDVEAYIPEMAKKLYEASFYIQSAALIEQAVQNMSSGDYSDYFLYILGKIYETDQTLRNEKVSAAYYKRLMDEFPGSLYWDESRDRYRYLKRRYIDIR